MCGASWAGDVVFRDVRDERQPWSAPSRDPGLPLPMFIAIAVPVLLLMLGFLATRRRKRPRSRMSRTNMALDVRRFKVDP